jgi:hypothetical protein
MLSTDNVLTQDRPCTAPQVLELEKHVMVINRIW